MARNSTSGIATKKKNRRIPRSNQNAFEILFLKTEWKSKRKESAAKIILVVLNKKKNFWELSSFFVKYREEKKEKGKEIDRKKR